MTASTHIENQIYLTLKIEGSDMPTSANLISKLTICENIMQMTPVLQFTLSDSSSATVRNLALTEGTKLELLLGKYKESAILRKFRAFGHNQSSPYIGPKFTANFIIDAPKYISGAFTESFEGSSSEVMSEIAQRSGLKSDVATTSDKMIWLNFGQTRAAFAEDVAMHGYIDDSSCMIRALSSEHVLIYKNVMTELIEAEPKSILVYNSTDSNEEALDVREIRDVSVSGVMNSWLNYGWKYPEHSLTGKEILNDKYDVQTSDAYLPINSEVKDEVTNARVEYCKKLDCRNTHKNYNKAYYINLRGRALLSQRLHVMIERPSELQLLDVVEFKQSELDGHSHKNSGIYIVTAKTIHVVNGSHYYEKLEISRCGVKEAGNTPLVG